MKKIISAVIAFALLLVFSGCSIKKDEGKKVVLTSFYPMYIFTANLMNGIDDIKVENMTEQNVGCLHDYQLLSKDMKALAKCEAFVINGAGMEGFMEKAMEQVSSLNVIEASTSIALIENEEHEHNDSHEESEHNHEHETNSHVWLDVKNAIVQVKNISAGLQKSFPQYAQRISANEQGYISRLEALDTEIKNALADLSGSKIISFHEAYEYFAKAYSLEILASIETDDGAEPSTKEISELVETIKKNNVKALFVEPTYSGNSAEILSRETAAKVYTLNPITSGDGELNSYEAIMRSNVETIKKALGDAQ
ncbi:MAG: metal ABC transporter substrate-binding protein [Clostridiales bacterium]|nr:metal ABC transporter substrate-binding protein [Clostridiales bacterium]